MGEGQTHCRPSMASLRTGPGPPVLLALAFRGPLQEGLSPTSANPVPSVPVRWVGTVVPDTDPAVHVPQGCLTGNGNMDR